MSNNKKKAQSASADASADASAEVASMVDFVAALAAQSAHGEVGGGGKGGGGGATNSMPSKEERIAKRLAKRKRKKEEILHHKQHQKKRKNDAQKQKSAPVRQQSKDRQERLLHQWRTDLAALVETHSVNKPRYLIKIVETSDRKPRNYPHVVQHKKMKTSLEPRKCDYGGLGLARPTLYLPFSDPSWIPRLEQEFAEHIPGWSGRPPMTQAMKKQRDANLLWRRLQREKQTPSGHKGRRMTPDERVEAMLQSGNVV